MAGPDAPAGLAAFAVDTMLGRLARWLRILGHDVAYGRHLRGRRLVDCARREGRVLLTRDTRLLGRRVPTHQLPLHVFVISDHFREQLRQVAAATPLGGGFLHRCLDCNCPLDAVSREDAAARVPPYVLATQERFERCPRCRRVYWRATHRAHMESELAALGLAATSGGPG